MMKKIISFLLVICGVLSIFQIMGCATGETENDTEIILQVSNPIMTVNNSEEEIDPGRGTVPVIVGDRTLVPIRAVIESMGGTVSWDNGDIFLSSEDVEIVLTVGSTTAYVNGNTYILDTAPTIINDRTMLPIRFVAEQFLFSVDWNETEQIIYISKVNKDYDNEDKTDIAQNSYNRIVIYFSATGNTKSLAEKIAEYTNSDIAEIVPEEQYTSDDLNYNDNNSRANKEINSDARPEIEALTVDISKYDTIFLGYPIWWGLCPPVIRTFLESYNLSGKTIMPFCTSGSTGIDGSLAKIKELAYQSNVTDGFRGTDSTKEEEIEQWLTDNNFDNGVLGRVKLKTEEGDIIIKLNNNSAAKNFLDMLPINLEFSDYSGTEKIAYPAEEIDVSDTESGTSPKTGDLTIYAPWGNLALFYRDGNYSSYLVPLGSVESGAEWLETLSGMILAEVY